MLWLVLLGSRWVALVEVRGAMTSAADGARRSIAGRAMQSRWGEVSAVLLADLRPLADALAERCLVAQVGPWPGAAA